MDQPAGAAGLHDSPLLVEACVEERRRLRRDLHDWLGPVLTGVALTTDAAHNLVHADPDRARDLLLQARNDLSETIDEIRRMIEDCIPAALDHLDLVEAIARQAEHLPMVAVTVSSNGPLDGLPGIVAVAAYWIAIEALHNVARHSDARRASVDLRIGACLEVEITDDGHGLRQWTTGVGLTSMRERAAEVGGTVSFGPTGGGGRVLGQLPTGSDHGHPGPRR